jgi:fructose-bisphosphate aldolase, class I
MIKEERLVEKNIKKLLKKGHSVMLAYDHGLEHGPSDFTSDSIDPKGIIEIAKKAKLSAIILQKGTAEKYYSKNSKIPLIIKLNGKTKLFNGEPISRQMCSVGEAKKLGAVAVGYTIYLGSEHETEMLQEFGKIQEEAHSLGIPVIAWMYPRGKSIKKVTNEIIEYAARVGLEIGADFVKIKFTNKEHFKKVVKEAGKCRVLALGGDKVSEEELLKEIKDIKDSGACGLAIGRNIWQSKEPIKIANKIKKIIFN